MADDPSVHSERIVLECTDHLSDRELYTMLFRDILPSCEKKVDLPKNYLHWRCLDDSDDQTWLRYYARPVERRRWQEATGNATPEPTAALFASNAFAQFEPKPPRF